MSNSPRPVIILGPTASGKTALAVKVASLIRGEMISVDSRQVYRGMTIGTGKDYEEYTIDGVQIPCHLIDLKEPGYEYNVFEFLQDFENAYAGILSRGNRPLLCGGSGMYIDAVVNGYQLNKINIQPELLEALESKTDEELAGLLRAGTKLHNTTDLLDRKRMIRALLIANTATGKGNKEALLPLVNPLLIGISFERELLRKRITERLEKRMNQGMVGEVEQLIKSGITPAQLKFYGLEYRYITQFIEGELSYDEMFARLNIAIHQFSKRQMTWFRKMEKEGHRIHWIDGTAKMEEKVKASIQLLSE